MVARRHTCSFLSRFSGLCALARRWRLFSWSPTISAGRSGRRPCGEQQVVALLEQSAAAQLGDRVQGGDVLAVEVTDQVFD